MNLLGTYTKSELVKEARISSLINAAKGVIQFGKNVRGGYNNAVNTYKTVATPVKQIAQQVTPQVQQAIKLKREINSIVEPVRNPGKAILNAIVPEAAQPMGLRQVGEMAIRNPQQSRRDFLVNLIRMQQDPTIRNSTVQATKAVANAPIVAADVVAGPPLLAEWAASKATKW